LLLTFLTIVSLLSIRGMTVSLQFVASTMRTVDDNRYHDTPFLSLSLSGFYLITASSNEPLPTSDILFGNGLKATLEMDSPNRFGV